MRKGDVMFLAYKMQVELLDVQPEVKRTFIIPAETTFTRLHDTLQFVMGWQDYHLYEFTVKSGDYTTRIVCDEEVMEEESGLLAHYQELLRNGTELDKYDVMRMERLKKIIFKRAWTYKLPQIFKEHKTVEYEYDFGDSWRHLLTLEEVIEDYPYPHPVLLEAEGACPPEDVGGPGGYAYFLEAWHDPAHEEHEEMLAWGAGQFQEVFNKEAINDLMKDFLRLKKVKK